MFICTPCRIAKTTNGEAWTTSQGNCEVCQTYTVCEDVPSAQLQWIDQRPVFVPATVPDTEFHTVVTALLRAVHGPAWERLSADHGRQQTILIEAADGPAVWDSPSSGGVRILTTPFGELPYLSEAAQRLPDLIRALWFTAHTTHSAALYFKPRPAPVSVSPATQWIEALDGRLLPNTSLRTLESSPPSRAPAAQDERLLQLYAVPLTGERALLCQVREDHEAALVIAIAESAARIIRPVELIDGLGS